MWRPRFIHSTSRNNIIGCWKTEKVDIEEEKVDIQNKEVDIESLRF